MKRTKVYCIAVLGHSPGVLTELAWWLVEQEDLDLVGLEVWTTSSHDENMFSGFRSLQQAMGAGQFWKRLVEALGDKADRIPIAPSKLILEEPRRPRLERRPFMVCGFEGNGDEISDVRDDDDSAAISHALHARVRELREQLQDVVLIGNLAGGRKTMSAALQSAFQLQARARDRLMHVLVHPDIERDKCELSSFAVPNEDLAKRMKIPIADQIRVYEVPFVPLRPLLEQNQRSGEEIRADFDREDALAIIGAFRRSMFGGKVSARLRHTGKGTRKGVYEIRVDRVTVFSVSLSPGESVLLKILAQSRDGATTKELDRAYRKVRARNPEASSEYGDTEQTARNNIQVYVNRLKSKVNRLQSLGFGDFAVETLRVGGRSTYAIRSGAKVELPEGDPFPLSD